MTSTTGPDLVFIYENAEPPKVRRQLFLSRMRRRLARNVVVTDQQIKDALHLSADEYTRKYRSRKTTVEINGQEVELKNLYKQFGFGVSYPTFRLRCLRLESLGAIEKSGLHDAGSMNRSLWMTHYGGGQRRPFMYDGNLFPQCHGKCFRGVAAFLSEIGRLDDRALIWSRLKAGWHIDDALEVPSDDLFVRSGSIYLVRSLECGRGYVGLTRVSVRQRWLQHLNSADQGAKTPLAAAVREYGAERFEVRVLESDVPSAELPDRERYWIAACDTRIPNGFNAIDGGGMSSPYGRQVEFNGRSYPSLASAGREIGLELGLEPHFVVSRLAKDEALPKTQRRQSQHKEAGTNLWRRWKSLLNAVKAGRRSGPISKDWFDYDKFADDVRDGYRPELRLTRIRDDEPWGRGNFRWVSGRESVEKTHGESLVVDGVRYPSWQAVASAYGVSVSTLKHRVRVQGVSLDEAVRIAIGPTSRRPCRVGVEVFPSLHQAAKYAASKYGLSYEVARDRLRRGRPLKRE